MNQAQNRISNDTLISVSQNEININVQQILNCSHSWEVLEICKLNIQFVVIAICSRSAQSVFIFLHYLQIIRNSPKQEKLKRTRCTFCLLTCSFLYILWRFGIRVNSEVFWGICIHMYGNLCTCNHNCVICLLYQSKYKSWCIALGTHAQ